MQEEKSLGERWKKQATITALELQERKATIKARDRKVKATEKKLRESRRADEEREREAR